METMMDYYPHPVPSDETGRRGSDGSGGFKTLDFYYSVLKLQKSFGKNLLRRIVRQRQPVQYCTPVVIIHTNFYNITCCNKPATNML